MRQIDRSYDGIPMVEQMQELLLGLRLWNVRNVSVDRRYYDKSDLIDQLKESLKALQE